MGLSDGAGIVDIPVKRGVDFSYLTTYLSLPANTPINLTGFSFLGSIVKQDGSIIADFTFNVIDAPNGKFSISIPHSVTATLPRGNFSYFVTVTDPSLVVSMLLKGAAFITDVWEI